MKLINETLTIREKSGKKTKLSSLLLWIFIKEERRTVTCRHIFKYPITLGLSMDISKHQCFNISLITTSEYYGLKLGLF